MGLIPLKPVQRKKDVVSSMVDASNSRSEFNATPKSFDPVNFPVYSFKDETHLIYVPRLTVIDEETGLERLNWARVLTHSVVQGGKYHKINCTMGLVDETPYRDGILNDGTCPICDAEPIARELVDYKSRDLLRSMGMDENDNSDQAKKLTQGIRSDAVIKRKSLGYTFPIVVFETEEKTPAGRTRPVTTIVTDEKGRPSYKIYWYNVSSYYYDGSEAKWKTELDRLSTELDKDVLHPGGLFFKLSGSYNRKENQKWSPMDAARNFKVSHYNLREYDEESLEQLKTFLDKKAVDWTPAKSMETVIANYVMPVQDLQEEIDKVIQPVKDQLSMLQLGNSVGSAAGNLPTLDNSEALEAIAAPQNKSNLVLDDDL